MGTSIPRSTVDTLAECLVENFGNERCSSKEVLEEYLCYDTLLVILKSEGKVKKFLSCLSKKLKHIDSLSISDARDAVESALGAV